MACSYHEALQIIQSSLFGVTSSESLPLFEALNRRASHAVYAPLELPKSAISLRDGYAITCSNMETISLSACALVSTGDALKPDIDAIISFEEAHIKGEYLHLPLHVKKGMHIKQQGEDIALNECLVHPHEHLSAYKITALAALGLTHIDVLHQPRVAILSIGNALTSLGEPLLEGSFYNSNAISLSARCMELGAQVVAIETVGEVCDTIMEQLEYLCTQADLVITTGGLSRGDVISTLLEEKRLTPLFQEVSITPAKPTSLCMLNKTPILHLPGLPLGSMLGFELLGVPLIKTLHHEASLLPRAYTQINGIPFTCKENSVSAIPGFSDGSVFVCAPHYEAGRLNILSQCNGYVRVDGATEIACGDEVSFIPFYM